VADVPSGLSLTPPRETKQKKTLASIVNVKKGTKSAIPEVSLNQQESSSVRLPANGVTYPQKCFDNL
jgi:hypothetical protein